LYNLASGYFDASHCNGNPAFVRHRAIAGPAQSEGWMIIIAIIATDHE
jgi:hypothetical protein